MCIDVRSLTGWEHGRVRLTGGPGWPAWSAWPWRPAPRWGPRRRRARLPRRRRSAPASATVVVDRGQVRFTPGEVSLAGGGTLTLVNLDTFDHTVTSVATDAAGVPLFDVRVAAGTSATITGVEALGEGSYAFFCKLHPQMRGVLVVEGGDGTVTPQAPDVRPAADASPDPSAHPRR